MGGPAERPCGFRALFAGVAGAGAAEDQRALAAALAADFGLAASECRVDHDLRIALAGARGGRAGAVVVAGTGSACFGETGDGRSWKAGGWGAQLDDGGSGHWLGMGALRAVVRSADGRETETRLTAVVAERLGLATPRAIIQALAAGRVGREAVAALAPDVLAAAEAGDGAAGEIVARGAGELATMAAAVWRRLSMGGEPSSGLAGTGSVLEKSPVYRQACRAALEKVLPGVPLEEPHLPAVAGAVVMALRVAGVEVAGAVLERLRVAAAR